MYSTARQVVGVAVVGRRRQSAMRAAFAPASPARVRQSRCRAASSSSSSSSSSWLRTFIDAVVPKDGASSSASLARMDDAELARVIADATRARDDALACAYDVASRTNALGGLALVRCYDAARDGWSARAFHDKCDARGPALVLGVTTKGTRFGAYNGVGWYSVEDYRACGDAFLMSWAKGARWTYEEGVACENVSDPAIYDFGAQGPCFGSDSLQIPLGFAPKHGSSYAGVGGSFDLGESNASGSKIAKSRLGSNFAAPSGTTMASVFSEGFEAELKDLYVFVAPALGRADDDDSVYVS